MKKGKPVQPASEEANAKRIACLIAGYIQNTLSKAQHIALDDWVNESMENQCMFERLSDHTILQEGLMLLQRADAASALDRIEKIIFPVKSASRP